MYLYGQVEDRISPTTFSFCISVFAFSFRHCGFDARYFRFSFQLLAFPRLSSFRHFGFRFQYLSLSVDSTFGISNLDFSFRRFGFSFQHLAFGILDLDCQLSAFWISFYWFQSSGIQVYLLFGFQLPGFGFDSSRLLSRFSF